MKADIIIDQDMQKVKLILDWKAGIVGQHLTADEAEEVVKLIEQASRAASREGYGRRQGVVSQDGGLVA